MLVRTKQLNTSENLVMDGGKLILIDGNASNPSVNFSGSTNAGLFLAGPSKIGFSTSGQLRMFVNTASVTSNLQLRIQPGITPGLAFDGDTDTGLLSPGSNQLSFITGGVAALTISDNQIVTLNSSGAMVMSKGTTTERPETPITGMVRYNTTTYGLEYYENSVWYSIDSFTRTSVTSSSYSATLYDTYIGVNYNTPTTITLPTGVENKRYIIKDESGNASTNPVTITSNNNQLFDGSLSITIQIDYGSVNLVFGGSQWYIF